LINKEKMSLNGNTIKIIAVIAMLIDHVGWAFVPNTTVLATIMHVLGKMTAPIVFFFIAEGHHYTHNAKKYLFRLAIFAVISHIPYNLYINYGKMTFLPTSIMFTLLCGLLCLIAYSKIENIFIKTITIIFLCIITLKADWGILGVLFILAFGVFYGNLNKQILSYLVLIVPNIIFDSFTIHKGNATAYTLLPYLGMLLIIPILHLYNGKKGGNEISKWLFYIIYPLQFLIIGAIYLLINS